MEIATIILSALTFLAIVGQLVVYNRQAGIMARQEEIARAQLEQQERQGEIARGQLELQRRQEDRLRDEAIGTFYRLAFDLVEELAKGNGLLTTGQIPADYNSHPRQVLREASSKFASLGNSAMMALNDLGRELDRYYDAVHLLAQEPAHQVSLKGVELLNSIASHRQRLGLQLDLANRQIPESLRYVDRLGRQFEFSARAVDPKKLPPGERPSGLQGD